jgi:hypothetical protein
MPKLNKLEKILLSFTGLFFLSTIFLGRSLAEQSGSSPESGTSSILIDTYNELVTLGYGEESGSLGTIWNRINSASTWEPSGTSVLASDVLSGKTYYDNSRTLQTGTLVGETPTSCPTGMIIVPAGDNQSGFCVDKYEAKNVGGVATSQASGTPWVSITQYDARDACEAAGKHLITEKEWLSIARDIEQEGWNWSGGTAGSGQMSDGHSDNSPANSLAASTDDDPCSGTGQTCDISTWNSQRRTYKLSNGEYIWDFGGNVWDWVDAFTYENEPYANNWRYWTACTTPDGRCGNTLATNDHRYGGDTTALCAFRRGGAYDNGTPSGAFTLALIDVPTSTGTGIGFRCAR